MAALEKEILEKSTRYKTFSVPSIFIGGGTPSLLSAKQTDRMMQALFSGYQIASAAEITIECNPGTVTEQKLRQYKESRINRISFGLQSSDEEELHLLGRIHSFPQFLRNYELARKIGFRNINIDLMYGLPGQTAEKWENTLARVLALRPEHISVYGLMIEEGTLFDERYGADLAVRQEGGKPKLLPEEDLEVAMYEMARTLLQGSGYQQYEISNFARGNAANRHDDTDGHTNKCKHNIRYWKRQNYLGLGLGSASLINEARFENTAEMGKYQNGDFMPEQIRKLSRKNQIEEYLFLGLRMMEGIERRLFWEEFGVELESIYGTMINDLCREGLLEQREGRVSLTDFGVLVSNYVLSHFIL